MAVVAQTFVPRASQADADRFEVSMGAAMEARGGPPAGLMAHIGHPSGDGLMLCNVWRTEADMRSFYDEVVLPKLAEAGLEPEEAVISPVWAFARP